MVGVGPQHWGQLGQQSLTHLPALRPHSLVQCACQHLQATQQHLMLCTEWCIIGNVLPSTDKVCAHSKYKEGLVEDSIVVWLRYYLNTNLGYCL